MQRALREFEVAVRREAGWGQRAPEGSIGDCVLRDGILVPLTETTLLTGEAPVPAAVARALLTRDFSERSVLVPARNVLRAVIGYYVGDKGLAVRRTLTHWQQY